MCTEFLETCRGFKQTYHRRNCASSCLPTRIRRKIIRITLLNHCNRLLINSILKLNMVCLLQKYSKMKNPFQMKVLEAEIQTYRKWEKLTEKGRLLLDYFRDLKKWGEYLVQYSELKPESMSDSSSKHYFHLNKDVTLGILKVLGGSPLLYISRRFCL
jgi:hypothetical protein